MNKRQKILVIDDDENIIRLLEVALEGRGRRILGANNALAGFELAMSENPDLIILDVHFPVLNGLDVLARLRRTEATRRVPVLILTTDESMTSKTTAYLRRTDAYVTKPFDVADLSSEVELLLGSGAEFSELSISPDTRRNDAVE